MADKRKLQGEIDKCKKKVNEGVEAFDYLWQKVQAATNTNQKEKYEADLKKEIKKLQRLRDQIKTWAASNDIKDKGPLLEYRKLIETQMERFKVVERETKTKAYSKEGLGQANKIDPATKEKEDCREWLNDSIDQVKLQIDQFETEIESLHVGNKKKKIDREKSGRIEGLRERIEKHRYHMKNLELVLRLLDNESLEVEKVNKLKDDVEYYIENCQEPDFIDDEGIYDDYDLETDLALSAEIVKSPSDSKDDDDDIPSPGSSVSSSSGFMTSNSPSSKGSVNANSPRKSKSSSTSSTNGTIMTSVNNNPTQSINSSRSKSFTTTTTITTSPPVTMATVTTAPSSPPLSNSISDSVPVSQNTTDLHQQTATSKTTNTVINKAPGPSPVTPYAVAAGAIQSSLSAQKSISNQQVSLASSLPVQASIPSQLNHVDSSQYSGVLASQTSRDKSLSDDLSQSQSTASSVSPISLPTSQVSLPDSQSESITASSVADVIAHSSVASVVSIQNSAAISNSISTSLSMTQSTNDALNLKSISGPSVSLSDQLQMPTDYSTKTRMFDGSSSSTGQGVKPAPQTQEVHLQPLLGVAPLGHVPLIRERMNQLNMLEAAFHHLPQRQDCERIKPYFPRNTVPIALYHHHQPPAHIDSLEFFQRLATETLFFIFYYQEGTRAQYLAAKALKKQSWRFHTKYMMWFQRHEEPKTITDEYEQGTYIFFDFEKWSQRKKEGFTFEYRYLEDKDLS